LVAYGATAQISGPRGGRTESFATLFKGPGKTSVGADEILTGITLTRPTGECRGSYVKYTIRNAMEIALVSVTTLVTLEKGTCTAARVVLGAVAPTFVRCQTTEQFLVGKKITEDVAEKAGKLVIDACSPITDLRASADYRSTLVQILVKRSLIESVSGAKN
jgi:carbon-monoxide dehydrogenase medium subunit